MSIPDFPSSILDDPLWPELRPYVRVNTADRSKLCDGKPRIRIELPRPPKELARKAMCIVTRCANYARCGSLIHPVRIRLGNGGLSGLYIGVACGLDVNKGCSRGSAAPKEYRRIQEDLEKHAKPGGNAQDALF